MTLPLPLPLPLFLSYSILFFSLFLVHCFLLPLSSFLRPLFHIAHSLHSTYRLPSASFPKHDATRIGRYFFNLSGSFFTVRVDTLRTPFVSWCKTKGRNVTKSSGITEIVECRAKWNYWCAWCSTTLLVTHLFRAQRAHRFAKHGAAVVAPEIGAQLQQAHNNANNAVRTNL